MKADIKWLTDISEKDKELASLLFDWKNKDKWDLGGLYPSGNRNLYFKLDEPIKSNNINFKFLKIKGHHYMKYKRMQAPEAKAYTGEDGNPRNIKVLRRNPSVPEGTIEHSINYGDYTLYLMKTYEKPNGCMFLEEVMNEVKIQNHLLENNCASPLPIGIVEYGKKFNGKKLGSHIMAIPDRDVRASHLMEGFLKGKISNKQKSELMSYAVELHFKGLKKLHDNNVVHLFAHFGNSALLPLKFKPFYCDFENSVLLNEKDKEYNKFYKAIDLSETFCRIYHLKRNLEKKKKIYGNFFDPAIKGYGLKDKEKEISFMLDESCFGSFIKFCTVNFNMVGKLKELV